MIDRNKRILIRESPFFAIPIFREAPFKADRLAFEGAPFLLKYSLAGLYEGVLSNSFPHLRLRSDQHFIGLGAVPAFFFLSFVFVRHSQELAGFLFIFFFPI